MNREIFEKLYEKYNRRRFVHPDPLEFLYHYSDPADREIVGLISSSLAYGRVKQILKSVSWVLRRMPSPSEYVQGASVNSLRRTFGEFKHRFTTGEELVRLLYGVGRAVERYGSLHNCFLSGFSENDETILPALSNFTDELTGAANPRFNSLLPSPRRGSACKRLNLFLRWMARRDDVDPGGWDSIPRSKLIIPLDTHIHKISLAVKLTGRRQADMRTAVEITNAFQTISPEDPVRYDFALTRLGIRDDVEVEPFLQKCGMCKAAKNA
ncbi:MAG: TIGR02757 family protein [bacterium]